MRDKQMACESAIGKDLSFAQGSRREHRRNGSGGESWRSKYRAGDVTQR